MKPSAILFICIALALLVYILLKERKIRSGVPLWLRTMAALIGVLALVLLLFPIPYSQKAQSGPNRDTVHILTEGIDSIKATNLIRQGACYTTDQRIAQTNEVNFIHDWPSFVKEHAFAYFSIYGIGLEEGQLKLLKNNAGTYHESPLSAGILTVHWDRQIEQGSELPIYGQYHNPSAKEVSIYLLSAAKAVDSAVILPQKLSRFQLSYQPKQQGNALFEVVAVVDQDTLQTEKIPVVIRPPNKLAVMLLAASPSSDYKFLYNWLQKNQHVVSYRARISKDKFLYSGNVDSEALLKNIGSTTFAKTALLMADEAELKQLTTREQETVLKAVRQGMGLILFGGKDQERSAIARLFEWRTPKVKGEEKTTIRPYDQGNLSDLLVSDLAALADEENLIPLFYGGERLIAGSKIYGQGRLTALTLQESYVWWLTGKQSIYTQFWSKLMAASLPSHDMGVAYLQAPVFPSAFRRTDVIFNNVERDAVFIGQREYPTINDPWIPSMQMLSFWPNQEGWSPAVIGKDTTFLYAFGDGDWRSAKNYKLTKSNRTFFFAQNEELAGEEQAVDRFSYVPDWVFFVLFFVAVGILWYSSRNYN